ncbi:hypothetical protein [Parasitella parasitica]|uniref:MARVEL domain-containing protein n=1 Tax=Parasitella parasitica TaxID=35722 RepID=A0A0B7NCP7_9FUNG|nr:hypothetical protein [Parasitella parasitica]
MISFQLNSLADNLEFDTPSSLPKLGIYKVGLHIIHIILAFATLCITVPIISAENTYKGSSQAAPNYTLVVALITLFISIPLVIFPWTLMTKKGFVSVRKFFLRPRTTVIFTCFMTLAWFVAMISMTAHSRNVSNCAVDNELKDDENYISAWSKQCNCAKASAAFSWFSFFVGVATVACSAILFWHEKKLRHAEANNQIDDTKEKENTSANNSDSPSAVLGDDAPIVIEMKYSDNSHQNTSAYENSSPQMQETTGPETYQPSSPVPMAVVGNDYISPYSPPTPISIYSPYSPQQQAYSPYQAHSNFDNTGYHQQPAHYDNAVVPSLITSPYPTSGPTSPSPHLAYRLSSLYQHTAASPAVYPLTTPSPLGQQQIPPSQLYLQEYNPRL